MKMKSKMVAIFSTLMIALMVLGVSYAMWSKTLYIDGTVNTGEVNAIFTAAWCEEWPEAEGKDIGSCSVTGAGTQMLDVTITNGYPSYGCTVWFTIDNTGTIPVKIQSISVVAPPPEIDFMVTGISVGQQIDAGFDALGDLEIHVDQSAAELATYTFSLEIYLVQWNEYM